jgi:hypothetical protein
MSCIVDEFLRSCEADNAVGGVFKIWIAKQSDVDTAAVTLGVVTAMTMLGAGVFYEMQFRPQSGGFTEVYTGADTGGKGFWLQTLTGTLSAHTPESRAFLDGLTQCNCGLVVVHTEDGNSGAGYQWVWGLRKGVNDVTIPILGDNLRVTAATNSSGVALADPNTAVVTFTSNATAQANQTTQDMSTLV